MPLTLTLSEGVLPAHKVKLAIKRLTDSMLEWHALTGNSVMTPNVTANVHIVPAGHSFSGGEEFSAAWVEWKVPSFAFASRDVQRGFGAEATAILRELSGRSLPKEHIFFNVVHTVDGAWNLGGEALSNAEFSEAIASAAPVEQTT